MMQKVLTMDFETGETTEITQDVNIGLPFLNNILRPAYSRMMAKGSHHTAIFFGGTTFQVWFEYLTPPGEKRIRRWRFQFGYEIDERKRIETQNKVLAAFRCWGSPKQEASWLVDEKSRLLFQVDEPNIIGLV